MFTTFLVAFEGKYKKSVDRSLFIFFGSMFPIYFVFSVQILNSNLFSCNMVYFKHHFFSYAFLSGFTKRYCFIFFDLMNFTVLILAHSSCALTNYLLFYSRPS